MPQGLPLIYCGYYIYVCVCIYIYIYIYIYILTNLLSTSIHGDKEKEKNPARIQR